MSISIQNIQPSQLNSINGLMQESLLDGKNIVQLVCEPDNTRLYQSIIQSGGLSRALSVGDLALLIGDSLCAVLDSGELVGVSICNSKVSEISDITTQADIACLGSNTLLHIQSLIIETKEQQENNNWACELLKKHRLANLGFLVVDKEFRNQHIASRLKLAIFNKFLRVGITHGFLDIFSLDSVEYFDHGKIYTLYRFPEKSVNVSSKSVSKDIIDSIGFSVSRISLRNIKPQDITTKEYEKYMSHALSLSPSQLENVRLVIRFENFLTDFEKALTVLERKINK